MGELAVSRLIGIAAQLARRAFTPDLDGLRTSREVRRRIDALDDRQADMAVAVRQATDDLARTLVAVTAERDEAHALLRDAQRGLFVLAGSWCHKATKMVNDPGDCEQVAIHLDAGAPGSCGECLACRIAAALAKGGDRG